MKVAIFGQFYHNTSEASIKSLLGFLKKEKSQIFIESDFHKLLNNKRILKELDGIKTFKSLDKSYDLLFSLGGDGTILRAVTFVKDLDIPIVGINTGRLGFLATIQDDDIQKALESIFKKEFTISERSLLTIETSPENKAFKELNFALNEITVSRKNTTSMITVKTYLDDEYLTSYWADGLIISTPTGSTGYSLSCNGPVITPGAGSFVLTPIAPHNLSARPLVIPDETKISLSISGREENYLVSLDSRIATLHNNTTVTLKKANFKIKLLELNSESFLKTLRKKMLWGEDRRN